jgi:hypothetical protein
MTGFNVSNTVNVCLERTSKTPDSVPSIWAQTRRPEKESLRVNYGLKFVKGWRVGGGRGT